MPTPLGDFLRARRAQVTPDSVGVPTAGQRRVPGLRREEVATTAGISVDYYVRLEQGREQSPSGQVLEALARTLQLDREERAHLFQLGGVLAAPDPAPDAEQAHPSLVELLSLWSETPAILLGRAYDVLAGNRLSYALFEDFAQGPNLLAKMFLDPGATTFYADWEDVARYTVAGFRVQQGRSPDDARIAEVLAELSARSPEFLAMWDRHEARGQRLSSKRFVHPLVGELSLQIDAFDVRAAPGQELIVYHATPGSPGAEALRRLRELAVENDG